MPALWLFLVLVRLRSDLGFQWEDMEEFSGTIAGESVIKVIRPQLLVGRCGRALVGAFPGESIIKVIRERESVSEFFSPVYPLPLLPPSP